ncbi:unnamed protein product [Linum trigynum]|uniref:Uncharacterized protein n=1 Tax=Linum trigynum TaxID=586398 RepID=A0AAV2EM26_9ROSI
MMLYRAIDSVLYEEQKVTITVWDIVLVTDWLDGGSDQQSNHGSSKQPAPTWKNRTPLEHMDKKESFKRV